jgi:transcriptional regulator with GAF, ATPase, and Fis domain
LPLGVQAKLLRALESGEFQRVGSTETRRVDVIVLAATNRDLRADTVAGRFRADLFYRLAVVEISVPPLADRREDIPYLTAAFLAEFVRRTGKQVAGVTADAERLLVSDPWEGNVRELRNVVERSALLADGDLISDRDVLESCSRFAASPQNTGRPGPRPEIRTVAEETGDRRALSNIERDHILSILGQTGGNKKAAAGILGISRRKLYRLLERHDTPA